MGYLVTRRLFREASIYLASCVLCFLPSFSLFLSYTLLISSESLAVVQVQISRPGEGEALCKALQLIAHTKSSPIPDVSIKQSPAGHLSLTFLRCNVTAVTHEREREQRKKKKKETKQIAKKDIVSSTIIIRSDLYGTYLYAHVCVHAVYSYLYVSTPKKDQE